MRTLSKKHAKELNEIFIGVLGTYRITVDETNEGIFESPYGEIRYHVYDDWVHFSLQDWGAPRFCYNWYGFKHWKVNYHTFVTQQKPSQFDPESIEISFNLHVQRFFYWATESDKPSAEYLTESKERRRVDSIERGIAMDAFLKECDERRKAGTLE